MIRCIEPGCHAEIQDNYWSKVKSGWFQTRDGRSWCPVHIPEWVEEWRKNKETKDA